MDKPHCMLSANGLLLRADLHREMDNGTIRFRIEDSDKVFVYCTQMGSELHNQFHGKMVNLPKWYRKQRLELLREHRLATK